MATRGLMGLVESYPQLKANENFRQLQTDLSDIENKLAAARRFFVSSGLFGTFFELVVGAGSPAPVRFCFPIFLPWLITCSWLLWQSVIVCRPSMAIVSWRSEAA